MPKEEGYLKVPGTENPVLERGPDGRMRKKAVAAQPELAPLPQPGDASNRDVVQLVWDHLESPSLPGGSVGRARSLWEWARKNKGEFLSKYVPLLVRGEEQAAPEWDGESPCPTCKRAAPVKDEGTERSIKLYEKLLKSWKERDLAQGGDPNDCGYPELADLFPTEAEKQMPKPTKRNRPSKC